MQFISIDEPQRPAAAPPGFALWQLGFRPFYLLASLFAALSIGLWAAQFAGWLGRPYLSGPLWHAHEMLFGFTLAVIVGFLFTAGRNWSNRPTPTGLPLAALAALWVAGRVLVLTPFGWAAAVVDAAFPLAAAAALAIPFWASRNARNYFFVGLLVLLGVADLGIHLSQLGVLDLPAWLGLQIALDMVLFIMAVMAGRVIPMFTNNGVPGAGAVRHAVLEKVAL
ncbi:MAG TPA: NnrS family protein, partial [Caldimonas sp.]